MNEERDIQGIELLRDNHAGAMQLKNGRTVNYGFIRITENEVVYYTGQGLHEMFSTNMTEEGKKQSDRLKKIGGEKDGEKKLIISGHIGVTALDDISRVLF